MTHRKQLHAVFTDPRTDEELGWHCSCCPGAARELHAPSVPLVLQAVCYCLHRGATYDGRTTLEQGGRGGPNVALPMLSSSCRVPRRSCTCISVVGSPAQPGLDDCVCANLKASLVLCRTIGASGSAIKEQAGQRALYLLPIDEYNLCLTCRSSDSSRLRAPGGYRS